MDSFSSESKNGNFTLMYVEPHKRASINLQTLTRLVYKTSSLPKLNIERKNKPLKGKHRYKTLDKDTLLALDARRRTKKYSELSLRHTKPNSTSSKQNPRSSHWTTAPH